MNKKKDLISITDLTASEIWDIFRLAKKLKKEFETKGGHKQYLQGKSLALIFEKQSLRTRISFEIGMAHFGGHTVYLDPRDTGIGVRESEADVAKVLSRMVDVIAARTYSHQTIINLASNASIPVINALSDLEHPCQALADLFTIWEVKGNLQGLTIGYVGDGENNVTHSLCLLSAILDVSFRCGSPRGFWMDKAIVKTAKKIGVKLTETDNPKEAIKNVDVVVTDTWVSMGDTNKEKRIEIFKKYQVNRALIAFAKKDAIFLHSLPAYRGKEVTDDVIDGIQSVVFQEAENRMHVQKALLLMLLGKV